MFTGIINEIGEIEYFERVSNNLFSISIKCHKILNNIQVGESIAVNGVCLSVKSFSSSSFATNIMLETINKTTFKNMSLLKFVNLERALLPNTRISGHFVSGHIDGIGKIIDIEKTEGNYNLKISAPQSIMEYIVYKGSIAINGVSLTIADINDNYFSVSLIPLTLQETNLKYLKINDEVNIETDLLGKYVKKFLFTQKKINSSSKITEEFLIKNL
ncbi:MAG TPA: riboflavin synthase [bacterium]|nr:riboflavin synthase [bacterium]HOL47589.1 riboflavin synthase [bacterium]HPQ18728.1 riboflavin synthase [bacterium]